MPVGDPQYTDYQSLPDDNQAAAPIGAPEGSYQGRWVNDTFRHMMAVIRRLGDATLLKDGTNAATGNLAMGGNLVTGLGIPTARDHAARVADLQDSNPNWGFTSGGSANAQTITPSPAVLGYNSSQLFRFIAGPGLTNTGPMTMNVSAQGPVAVRDRYGNPLTGGEVVAGRRHAIEHDGTAFRLLDPANWMDQAIFNLLVPIDTVVFRHDTATPTVPKGVTATWTLIAVSRHLKIDSAAAPGTTGGSNVLPAHLHSDGTLQVDHTLRNDVDTGGSGTEQAVQSIQGISGNTGNPTSSPSIENEFYTVRAWRRTA